MRAPGARAVLVAVWLAAAAAHAQVAPGEEPSDSWSESAALRVAQADPGDPAATAGAPADPPRAPAPKTLRRSPGIRIEETTVTARKREEKLQETPVSATAFSADDLVDRGVRRSDDVERYTPNLKFDLSGAAPNSARLQIRGIGSADDSVTRDPAVGVYLDGVYLARAQGQLLSANDVERIEVLRGPQGTLWGRNAIGGAINLVTRKPGDDFGADLELRTGNYNLLETRGALNVPLIDERAAARFSFASASRDGYTKNVLSGQETDDRKLLDGRLSLRLDLTPDSQWLLSAGQTRVHTAGRGGECRFVPQRLAGAIGAGLIQALDQLHPELPFQQSCAQSRSDGELRYASPIDGSFRSTDTWGVASNFSWDFDGVTFRSISSWRRQELSERADLSFNRSSELAESSLSSTAQDQWSQEMTWTGGSDEAGLVWTFGIFGLRDTTAPGRQGETTRVGFELCEAGLDCGASDVQHARTRVLAYGAYGQTTVRVTDRMRLTVGLRRSLEHRKYRQALRGFTSADERAQALVTDQSVRFAAWTPRLDLSYALSDDVLAYATYSRGFRSGGFDGRPAAGPSASLEPFGQETLDDFEVGLKSRWFDDRLVADLSLFHGNYRDLHPSIHTLDPVDLSFATRISSASSAVVRGGELELQAMPWAGLELRAGLGFTDAHYRDYIDFTPGTAVNPDGSTRVIAVPVDRSGEDFINTPTFTATLSAAYTWYGLFGLGDFTARVGWFHSTAVNYGPSSPFHTLVQGKYGVLSGRLALLLADRRTEVALFGENLLDRRFLDSGVDLEEGLATSIALYAPPRMYGLEVRRSF